MSHIEMKWKGSTDTEDEWHCFFLSKANGMICQ